MQLKKDSKANFEHLVGKIMNRKQNEKNEYKNSKINILIIFKLIFLLLLLLIDISILAVIKVNYFEVKIDSNKLKKNWSMIEKNNSSFKENVFMKNKTNLLIDIKPDIINKNNIYFHSLYKTTKKHEKVVLINKLYIQFLEELIIENNKIKKTNECIFSDPGLHQVVAFFNMENLNSAELMFFNIVNLISINFTNGFFSSKVKNLHGIFQNCKNLKYINFNNNQFNNIIDFSYSFQNCISLDFLNFTNLLNNETLNISYMFANCSSLSSIDLSRFNTINVKNMDGLFYNCSSLTSIDLSSFNTTNVLSMKYMFANCVLLSKINLNFLQIINLKDMSYMFENCLKLTSLVLPSLEGKININKEGIFLGCKNLNKTKYDFCIVGSWFAFNYGCLSTYYALHQTVKNMGYSILMIDSPRAIRGRQNLDKCDPLTIGKGLYNISDHKRFSQLHEFNDECEAFLVGSDQIWRPKISRYYKNFFYLNFVDDNKKKIAYATSYGVKYKGNKKEKTMIKFYLKRFNSISVRDQLSVNITKNIFGIKNVKQVCDPTFLCNFSDYERLANKSKLIKTNDYILAYVLDPNKEKGHRLEKLSLDKNITVIILLDEDQSTWNTNKKNLHLRGKGNILVKKNVDLNDFMWYYNHSKAVFTDSFHGTVFSIIFKKPFVSLRNIERGGERFNSLLDPIDLKNRLFETPKCINDQYELYEKIDYEIPYQKLNEIKKTSYNWLKNALKK